MLTAYSDGLIENFLPLCRPSIAPVYNPRGKASSIRSYPARYTREWKVSNRNNRSACYRSAVVGTCAVDTSEYIRVTHERREVYNDLLSLKRLFIKII